MEDGQSRRLYAGWPHIALPWVKGLAYAAGVLRRQAFKSVCLVLLVPGLRWQKPAQALAS